MLGAERLRAVEKQVLLSVVDMRWREHLSLLDHLRSVIHLRGYAQRDPLNEFKTEAFTLFERMLLDLRTTVTRMLLKLQIGQADEQIPQPRLPAQTYEIHQNPDTGENEMAARGELPPLAPEGFDREDPRTWGKVSRNAPCPCGSGKKFKYCHGAEALSA
jgi:preprotein translocase subunit SecA